MTDYSYQPHSAEQVVKDALKGKKAVLAGTPGCGKTVISHIAINKYIEKYPNAKILVLTHGQNLLKNQYIDSLLDPKVDINFSFGTFDSDWHTPPQVMVGLPQSIKSCPWDKIDLLIVDECHEFYLQKMVQNIIKKLKPTHQILLTGSPSEFIRLNKETNDYAITFISGEELIKNNIFSKVEMSIVKVDYKKNARRSVATMFEHAKKEGKDLSKIMIAVLNISEAQNVTYYLRSIGRKVALSTCKNDRHNLAVRDFKNNEYDTLVVVQRGILGFSDNNITGLLDLRCSPSVDISNQLFARVLRKHPDNVEKFYYRCSQDKKDYRKQAVMLHKIKAMMRRDIFTGYDGTNMAVEL